MANEKLKEIKQEFETNNPYMSFEEWYEGMFEFQECKDPEITYKFSKFHEKLVNEIISWCRENNVKCDCFSLYADGLLDGIKYGSWGPGTDSSFIFKKEAHDKNDYLHEI